MQHPPYIAYGTRPTAPTAKPAGPRFCGPDRRAPLREGLSACGQYGATQTAGRFYPMACVALEITQRCNLDCTLCYLSDRAEMTFDPPLPVLFARLAMIHSHYGSGTSVQLTGGDPTLRSDTDLEALCREIRRLGMRSCLMTNGIRARRPLLARLAAAGLDDVAFHVDMTQERRWYDNEQALNKIRSTYVKRARGLGLRILFNTTVFDGNRTQIAALARYFRNQPDVAFVSFQLQADTGRGLLRARPEAITQDSVAKSLEDGYATSLDLDAVSTGHSRCNRYGSVLITGGKTVSLLTDRRLLRDLIQALDKTGQAQDGHLDIMRGCLRVVLRRPRLAARALWYLARRVMALGPALRHGLPRRQTIFIHNFMAADQLDEERCKACVFMVATANGPLSMCAHNARRDAHLTAVQRIDTPHGPRWWNAAAPGLQTTPELPPLPDPNATPCKKRKGRLRQLLQTGAPR